ncbi:hypothetical protein DCAR_0830451 [Daucus carota subsp. sativus]|uniref:Bromo domain-containing protein n=2 Tax=Daucus carota subsp. sativus TaxID=79200 RepID=A0A175YJJ7_DAUCS|nr:hypothetical protein DCAR_0830451 [Daucus carota subsp. sativus]
MMSPNSKTINPNAHARNAQQPNHTKVCPKSSRDDGVIFDLDSYSEPELQELKKKFISNVERIRSFVKQIEARESNSVAKKRAMPMIPDKENNEKYNLDSTESRRVEAAMMKKCGVILDNLMKHKHGWVFNKPVDVVALRLSDYYEVVKRPMDLGTIKSKLGRRGYRSPHDFAKDVRLTFENAMLYNRKGEDVYVMASVLSELFGKLFDPAYERYENERRSVIVEHERFERQEAAEKYVVKKQRRVAEELENRVKRWEMSVEERDRLGHALQDLIGEYLDEILQIVAKRNPEMIKPDAEGEIELDVFALDNETLWDLDRFVRLNPKAGQKKKAI